MVSVGKLDCFRLDRCAWTQYDLGSFPSSDKRFKIGLQLSADPRHEDLKWQVTLKSEICLIGEGHRNKKSRPTHKDRSNDTMLRTALESKRSQKKTTFFVSYIGHSRVLIHNYSVLSEQCSYVLCGGMCCWILTISCYSKTSMNRQFLLSIV